MLRSIKIKALNSRTIREFRQRLVLLTSQDFYIVNEFSRTNRIVAKSAEEEEQEEEEEEEQQEEGNVLF